MPLLARAKRRVGDAAGLVRDRSARARQNLLCAYLSVALLVGLGANALVGWWWADPLAALVDRRRRRAGRARELARRRLRLLRAVSSRHRRLPRRVLRRRGHATRLRRTAPRSNPYGRSRP